MNSHSHSGVEVVVIETSDLGDHSYVIGDGSVAAVIDPQRDVDRVLAVVEERGWTVDLVVETHIHNDYVSGGLDLARRTGARYAVAADEDVEFDRLAVRDGDRLAVGEFELEVVATPGHTPHHVSYVAHVGEAPVAAFTGGSVLYGAVGRTDLVSDDLTEDLARHQHRSARRLAEELPSDASLYPTHGFGSFCSSNRHAAADTATLAEEEQRNPVYTIADEEEFVADLIASYTLYPSYYQHMGPTNRRGPEPVDLTPPPFLAASELQQRIDGGAWVVDLRDRRSFALAHRPGTINIEGGDYFATYAAWVLPFDADLTLVATSEGEVHEAQRALARVGFDSVTGRALGPAVRAGGHVESYPVAGFADLAAVRDDSSIIVLDVRRDDEWEEGHLPGAVHIHLPELPDRVGEIPDGEVWVHCAAGFRASLAASIVAARGRDVVFIDDEWERVEERGLEVVRPHAAAA